MRLDGSCGEAISWIITLEGRPGGGAMATITFLAGEHMGKLFATSKNSRMVTKTGIYGMTTEIAAEKAASYAAGFCNGVMSATRISHGD